MLFSKSFTTVTPLSKILALFLFILFPLVGFQLGMEYMRNSNSNSNSDQSMDQQFTSKDVCENTTGKLCNFFMCDDKCDKPGKWWSPSNQPITSQTIDDISNWKTYRNEKLGFEFKYPDRLEINISDNANPNRSFYYLYVGFFPKGADETVGDFLAVTVDNEHESIDEYLTSIQCSEDKEGCTNPDQYTPVNLSGNPAKEITIDEGVYSAHRVISQKDGFIFKLNVSFNRFHEDFYSKEEKETLFTQILSTFRFLDNNPTSITPIQQGHQCSVYYDVNDNPITACTTCGDNVCEKYESCTPTKKLTTDCGRLFCPGDCEK